MPTDRSFPIASSTNIASWIIAEFWNCLVEPALSNILDSFIPHKIWARSSPYSIIERQVEIQCEAVGNWFGNKGNFASISNLEQRRHQFAGLMFQKLNESFISYMISMPLCLEIHTG
jgi:hypothetical protein